MNGKVLFGFNKFNLFSELTISLHSYLTYHSLKFDSHWGLPYRYEEDRDCFAAFGLECRHYVRENKIDIFAPPCNILYTEWKIEQPLKQTCVQYKCNIITVFFNMTWKIESVQDKNYSSSLSDLLRLQNKGIIDDLH